MNVPRKLLQGTAMFAVLFVVGACGPASDAAQMEMMYTASAAEGVPVFEYDPSFPSLPLPNQWIMGEHGGVDVDDDDNIWIIQRPWTVIGRELAAVNNEAMCCRPAPPVIQFDYDGNVLGSWPDLRTFQAEPGTAAGQGGTVGRNGATLFEAADGEYGEWGRREHTVYVDHNGFVWTTNDDSHIIYKFTQQGEFVLSIGVQDVTRGSNDTETLGRPAGLKVDSETNELFVADGYTNKRIIVFDAETGEYRRHWGAYGRPPQDIQLDYAPGDNPEHFIGPVHGIDISSDHLVYVTDRRSDRYQVFELDGTFVEEVYVAPETLDAGSAYGLALSHEENNEFVYVNDGSNNRIWIVRRSTGETVGNFASYGRNGGQVLSAHRMAVDSQGNVYIAETRGRRLQRFLHRGYQ